ncbi:MAG: CoA-binding protein, partial [Deltaproteobacteria bacterium]|nr:CoA-binding protein [Deltaproteobacteria bacterium]
MSNGVEDIFKTIFNPKSIAVFGASSNEAKSGTGYLQALMEVGYPGRLYPIHPKDNEILGLKAYASIRDCPEPVDYAMFCVPAHLVLDLVEDCGANGVKAMQLFTAGFKETGEPDGIELEKKMVRIARRHGIRIIGPNCIGIYCPESRIPYGMVASPMEPGDVGFLSQSGGHAGRIIFGGFLQGLRYSKVISYGNGCDLNAVDFLKFFESDQNTKVIGAYLEGIQNVRPFFQLAKKISRGGQTDQGKKILLSHTGSLAGSFKLWEQTMKQSGAVMVRDFEELSDTLLTFSNIPYVKGNRLIMTTGLMGGGGGISVAGTDTSIQEGLDVISLSTELQERIVNLLPIKAGTIVTNPIDTGSAMNLTVLRQIIEIVINETECNMILIQEFFDRMADFFGQDVLLSYFTDLSNLGEKSETPIVLVWPPEASTAQWISLRLQLIEKGITIYPSLRR